MTELASQYGRYGYRRITILLRQERFLVNHKRVELKPLVDAGRLDESDIARELGFIAAGLAPGRTSAQECIMAVLVGLGAHDVYIAGQVPQGARRRSGPARVPAAQ